MKEKWSETTKADPVTLELDAESSAIVKRGLEIAAQDYDLRRLTLPKKSHLYAKCVKRSTEVKQLLKKHWS